MKRILSKVGSTLIAAIAVVVACLVGAGIGEQAGYSAVNMRYEVYILWDLASIPEGYVALTFGVVLAATLVVAVLAVMLAAATTYSLLIPAFILGTTSSMGATLFIFAPTMVRLDERWSALFIGAVILAAGLSLAAGERMRRLVKVEWFPSTA